LTSSRKAREREWHAGGETTLDGLLSALENPTRRKILERLARESHYPLQLSKELGVSQQAVVKHLRALEECGLVMSSEEKSDLGGPNRRAYRAQQYLSVQIDVGPSLFHAMMRPLRELPSRSRSTVGPRTPCRGHGRKRTRVDGSDSWRTRFADSTERY